MERPEKAVEFVADWWELNGNIITTLQALRRLKNAYPRHYLLTFCRAEEIATETAALQEICEYLENVSSTEKG